MPSLGTAGDGSNVGGGRGGGGGGWDDTDEGGNDVWDQDDEWGDLFEDTDVGGGADGGADVDDAQLGRNTRTESARSLPSAGLAMQTKKTTKMNFTKPKPKSKPATIGLGRSTKPERKKSPLHKVVPDSPSQKKKKEDDLFGSVRRVLRASPLFCFSLSPRVRVLLSLYSYLLCIARSPITTINLSPFVQLGMAPVYVKKTTPAVKKTSSAAAVSAHRTSKGTRSALADANAALNGLSGGDSSGDGNDWGFDGSDDDLDLLNTTEHGTSDVLDQF
tara:strand:+ start:247 stop:1071 length:825 start_codon:yes stop_codon:yes gene_type:complete